MQGAVERAIRKVTGQPQDVSFAFVDLSARPRASLTSGLSETHAH